MTTRECVHLVSSSYFRSTKMAVMLLPCWQIKTNITLNISLMLQTVECY